MVAKARVDDVLLIGGDIAKPVGKVPDVLSVIESGALQRAGIKSVGVGGFPDDTRPYPMKNSKPAS